MIEKKLEDLLKDLYEKRSSIFYGLNLQLEDNRTNRVSRAEKQLSKLQRLAQEWNKKLYDIDRYIKENLAACLISPNEDIRKRAQQHHQKNKKKKKKGRK